MIVVYGTTGELIKLAPLLHRMERRGTRAVTVCTGQQPEQIPVMLRDFGLRQPDYWLARGHGGRDLARPAEVPRWMAQVARGFLRARPALRRARGTGRPLVLVHGDTFTTVLGALIGRAVGATVAHLEGGLRSGDWRNPFPEEVNRRITSRIATVHFAPGAWAAGNLRRAPLVRGRIVDTGANTIRDSLEMARGMELAVAAPDEPFGLVSIHRFELLNDRPAFRAFVELLRAASRRVPLLFIDHPVTAGAIGAAGLADRFDDRLRRIPRQRYFPFLALLRRSAFLLTDSGGSQEECAQLGHPCLVHRAVTERRDGLQGGAVVLSGLDPAVVERFLAGPWTPVPPPGGVGSPTAVILDDLERHGFVPAAR